MLFDCLEAKNMAPFKNEPGTDRLSTIDIANEFTDRNTNRKRNFGTFLVNDVL